MLGWLGTRIYSEKPPIPERVVTPDGRVVVSSGEVSKGQKVWQAMGGMEVGSIWGHGSYVAPDWSADWLHRECLFMLDDWSTSQLGQPYDSANPERGGFARTVERVDSQADSTLQQHPR